MPQTVREVMNRELLAFRPDAPARDAVQQLRSRGVGTAPVVDDERHPVGVVSLPDVVTGPTTVSEAMDRPAHCVDESDTIEHAARRVARGDIHHLVVVDSTGAAVGMVSALDLLRAVLGMPPHHPRTFPHWDETTQLSWSDEWPLEHESLSIAPDGPGVFVLLIGAPAESERMAWAQPSSNVRASLADILCGRVSCPALEASFPRGDVFFRAASVTDEAEQERVASLLRDEIDHIPPPGST